MKTEFYIRVPTKSKNGISSTMIKLEKQFLDILPPYEYMVSYLSVNPTTEREFKPIKLELSISKFEEIKKSITRKISNPLIGDMMFICLSSDQKYIIILQKKKEDESKNV